MAKKYNFEVDSSDYESKVHELEIETIRIWDNLPDYCKTPQTLEKIKAIACQTVLDKLTKQESLGHCG